MRTRRRNGDEAISASESSRFSLIADAAWSAQDGARAWARRTAGRVSLAAAEGYWALRDRAETAGAPARALGVTALVLAAAALGVAGLIWAAPDRHPNQATVAEVAAPAPAPTPVKQAQPQTAPVPTLHGAAPDFKASAGTTAVGAAEGVETADASAAGKGNSTAGGAGAKISSQPGGGSAGSATTSSSSATTTSAKARPARGPVAGPAALAVAREFAAAFVGYEVGGAEDPAVRKGFAATTTPELRRALLQRPPRQPATVKVPEARVLNVVPAPSRDHVFPVSVSLLRVGTTSELRLEMKKLEGKRWRVTNVLG